MTEDKVRRIVFKADPCIYDRLDDFTKTNGVSKTRMLQDGADLLMGISERCKEGYRLYMECPDNPDKPVVEILMPPYTNRR